jgi:hypothetical protein
MPPRLISSTPRIAAFLALPPPRPLRQCAFSTSGRFPADDSDHYATLEVPPNATHAEIKRYTFHLVLNHPQSTQLTTNPPHVPIPSYQGLINTSTQTILRPLQIPPPRPPPLRPRRLRPLLPHLKRLLHPREPRKAHHLRPGPLPAPPRHPPPLRLLCISILRGLPPRLGPLQAPRHISRPPPLILQPGGAGRTAFK